MIITLIQNLFDMEATVNDPLWAVAAIFKNGRHAIQCVPQKRKPINRVNFSENCNDLSEKAYIFTKFSLSSFFWHQLQDVLHEQALTISNGDVKNDFRMGI